MHFNPRPENSGILVTLRGSFQYLRRETPDVFIWNFPQALHLTRFKMMVIFSHYLSHHQPFLRRRCVMESIGRQRGQVARASDLKSLGAGSNPVLTAS